MKGSRKNQDFQNESLKHKNIKLFYLGFILNYAISAIAGKKTISSLNFVGWITYVFFFAIIDYRILLKLHLIFLENFFCILGIAFFGWHIISVYRCKPKLPKLSKEEKQQKKLQDQQERSKKFLRKLFLKEPILKISDSTLLTILDFYFLTSCLQKILS